MQNFLNNRYPNALQIRKIPGEASSRSFFRIKLPKGKNLIAMVYPHKAEQQIRNIVSLTDLYQKHGILVPAIQDIIANRIVVQTDLGVISVQRALKRSARARKQKIVAQIAEMAQKIRKIPVFCTNQILDHKRMKYEMDFFIKNFAAPRINCPELLKSLHAKTHAIVDSIEKPSVFAHRDFHSRNMVVAEDGIGIVDFQDSLQAPFFYDSVSFAFDSYIDLNDLREYFLIKSDTGFLQQTDQFYLTALQRNIKALGTFGFQMRQRNKKKYAHYIPQTFRHLEENPLLKKFIAPEEINQLKGIG